MQNKGPTNVGQVGPQLDTGTGRVSGIFRNKQRFASELIVPQLLNTGYRYDCLGKFTQMQKVLPAYSLQLVLQQN